MLRWLPRPTFLLAVAALAGCTSYTPLPLAAESGLVPDLSSLQGSTDLPRPLDVAAVARLAVLNSPDLRANRAQHGVAQAQLLQAGIMPNPTITGAILPLAAGVGSTVAWSAGLNYDLKSLLTLSTRRRSADAAAMQVDAQILWQEWQIAGQARLLAVDLIEGARALALLSRTETLLQERRRRSDIALRAGNATLATVAPDIAAVQATRTQLADLRRLQLSRLHQLASLIGLSPEAPIPLVDRADLPPLDLAAIRRELPRLADRRPDLIALRFGYRVQDAKVRVAILAQFPNLTFGVSGGSDNSNVRNVGPSISLELPIFDRNQGNIDIERATRQQLHDEYSARLAAAEGAIGAALSEIALLEQQMAAVKAELPSLAQAAARASSAFGTGAIDDRSYVDLVSAQYGKEQELVVIEQSLLEQRVALATLTGAGLPTVSMPPEVGQ